MRDYRTDVDYQRQERLAAQQALCDHKWSINSAQNIRWCPKCMLVEQKIMANDKQVKEPMTEDKAWQIVGQYFLKFQLWLVVFLTSLVRVIGNGVILSYYWNWFFKGVLTEITLTPFHAIMIALTLRLFINRHGEGVPQAKREKEIYEAILKKPFPKSTLGYQLVDHVSSLIAYGLLWLIGYIIHGWSS